MTGASRLVARLGELGLLAATAESLTGGALTATIVEVPGASAVLRGGIVAYATEVKSRVLGVRAELLAEHGPVHPDVAIEMARGARRVLGADVGLATTGVAGPGPADGEAPGTVYVAVAVAGRSVVRGLRLPGTRPAVRRASTGAAIALALGVLDGREQARPGARWIQ